MASACIYADASRATRPDSRVHDPSQNLGRGVAFSGLDGVVNQVFVQENLDFGFAANAGFPQKVQQRSPPVRPAPAGQFLN